MSQSKTAVIEQKDPDYAGWRSVSGETFRIRIAKGDGNERAAVPDALSKLILSAFAELAKGGDPLVVLQSARVVLQDADNKVIWPVEQPAIEKPKESTPAATSEAPSTRLVGRPQVTPHTRVSATAP